MRVTVRWEGATARFRLDLLPGEGLRGTGQFYMTVEMVVPQFRVTLPEPIPEPHPDLVALAALTVARPWTRHTMMVERGVSPRFAEAVERALGIEVCPVDSHLTSRTPGPGRVLSYSGGPDSIASRLLLGPLPLWHLVRVTSRSVPNRAGHITAGVTRRLVESAAGLGEEVVLVESDLEFVAARPFPTYPQTEAVLAGPVLAADKVGLGTLALGRTLNGTYVLPEVGARRPDPEMAWIEAFAAAGVNLVYPVASMFEVVTRPLARRTRLGDLSRSCARGTDSTPCLSCRKCAWSQLLLAALEQRPMEPTALARLAASREVVADFSGGPPYPSQPVLEYALARVPDLEGTVFDDPLRILRPTREATAWTERYHAGAIAEMAAPIGRELTGALEGAGVEPMTPREQEILLGWVADPAARTTDRGQLNRGP